MNPRLLLPICLTGIVLSLSPQLAHAQQAMATAPPPARSNGIVATVNGRPILRSEVEELNKVQRMQIVQTVADKDEQAEQLARVEKLTLDTLIEQELILKEFEPFEANFRDKVNAYTDEHIKNAYIRDMFKGNAVEFRKQLALSGLSYKKFYEKQRTNIIVQMMRGQFVKDVGFVTSDEKEKYLREHIDDFREPGQIKLWSISLPRYGNEPGSNPASQMALAKEIRAKLVSGSDFASMAKTYSQDSRSSSGGDWGFITKKDLSGKMGALVFGLAEKKISQVIEFEGSYYIFWVEAKVPGKMKPQEEVDKQLENLVMMEKRKTATEEWIAKLRKKATIRYIDPR